MKIAAAVVLTAISLGLAACGGDDDETTSAPAPAPAPTATEPAPTTTESTDGATSTDGISETFVSSCAEGGALSEDQCQCIYDTVDEKGDIDELVQFGLAVQSGESDPTDLPKSLQDAIVNCTG